MHLILMVRYAISRMISLKHLRPMLMNVRGSKKSRKLIKKAYVQLVSPKIK